MAWAKTIWQDSRTSLHPICQISTCSRHHLKMWNSEEILTFKEWLVQATKSLWLLLVKLRTLTFKRRGHPIACLELDENSSRRAMSKLPLYRKSEVLRMVKMKISLRQLPSSALSSQVFTTTAKVLQFEGLETSQYLILPWSMRQAKIDRNQELSY